MSSMRVFPHQSRVRTGKLWSMLHGIADDKTRRFEHTTDIVNAALNGRIDLDQVAFNHAGYEQRSKFNATINKHSKNKEVSISSDAEMGDSGSAPLGSVSESRILDTIDRAFDIVENSKALREGIKVLAEVRDRMRKEYGIDPVLSLLSSLEGVDSGSAELVSLCNQSPDMKDTIVDLLESGRDLNNEDVNLIDLVRDIV